MKLRSAIAGRAPGLICVLVGAVLAVGSAYAFGDPPGPLPHPTPPAATAARLNARGTTALASTNLYLTMHACPPHEVAAVLQVITKYKLTADKSYGDGRLPVAAQFKNYAARSGDADEVHAALRKDAPLAAWTVHDEPTEEYLGTFRIYTPADGEWSASCNADGEPQFSRDAVRRAVEEGEEEVKLLLGDDWFTAVEAMPAGEVVEPRRRPVSWDRKTGIISVENPDGDDEEQQLSRHVRSPRANDVTVDRGEVNEALREAGYVIAEGWSSYARFSRINNATVYRVDDFAPAGWRWCATCGGLILDPDAPGLPAAGSHDGALCIACGDPA